MANTLKQTVNELIRIYLLGQEIGPQPAQSVVYQAGTTYKATNPEGGTLSTTSTTDVGAVVNAAIDAMPSAGGKVIVKAGIYTSTTKWEIDRQFLTIEGEGYGTLINFNGSTLSPVIGMADTTVRAGIILRDMRLDATTTGAGTAINMDYCTASKIENVWIADTNIGIDINTGNSFYNVIENVRIGISGSGAVGIRLGKNEQTVIRTRIIPDASSTGVYVDAHGCGLYSVNVETSALIGVDLTANANDTLLSDCYLEANATNLRIASGVEGLAVIGGFIADGTTANITDNGAKDPLIYTRLEYESYVKFPFQNKGTGTINSAATSAVITHGLNYTPAASEISITLTENPTNTPGAIWVDTITSTAFTVNCENDPGASNLDFSWSVRRI